MGMTLKEFSKEEYDRLNFNCFNKPLYAVIKVSKKDWNEWTDDIMDYNELDVVVDSEGITVNGLERQVELSLPPSKSRALVNKFFNPYMTVKKLKELGFTLPVYESRISLEAMKDTESDIIEDTTEELLKQGLL